MEPKRSLLPELDLLRRHAIARPMRRPRHRADGELSGVDRDRFLEGHAALERGRLFARPGADLRHARARSEISVGVCGRNRLDMAARAYLALQRLPIKCQR